MSDHSSYQQLSDIEQVPNYLLTPEFHLDVLDDLTYSAECDGKVPLASFPDNRYPYAYPRDIACITRAWIAALEAGIRPEECRNRIIDAARFHLAVQQENGAWQQRYSLDGTDTGIYVQEDNTGHGLRILAHAVRAIEHTDVIENVENSFRSDVINAIERATHYIRDELFDPNATLIESTTSIHEGRIESGYTLWVNCTFISALRQAEAALTALPEGTDSIEKSIENLRSSLENSVRSTFTTHSQVPRRFSPEGNIDLRPDVTLLAPYYFSLDDLFGDSLDKAAVRATNSLEDPCLGGLQRFLGFYNDYEVQQHGGNGPWMQYTAWQAQYHFDRGEIDRGDDVLGTILGYADEDGYLPEHLTTRARFDSFMENEWDTRQDFEKEFDEEVLRDAPFDLVVEELGHMKDSYQDLEVQTRERDVVSFALPLAWSHAEFLVALLHRADSQ